MPETKKKRTTAETAMLRWKKISDLIKPMMENGAQDTATVSIEYGKAVRFLTEKGFSPEDAGLDKDANVKSIMWWKQMIEMLSDTIADATEEIKNLCEEYLTMRSLLREFDIDWDTSELNPSNRNTETEENTDA